MFTLMLIVDLDHNVIWFHKSKGISHAKMNTCMEVDIQNKMQDPLKLPNTMLPSSI